MTQGIENNETIKEFDELALENFNRVLANYEKLEKAYAELMIFDLQEYCKHEDDELLSEIGGLYDHFDGIHAKKVEIEASIAYLKGEEIEEIE